MPKKGRRMTSGTRSFRAAQPLDWKKGPVFSLKKINKIINLNLQALRDLKKSLA